MKLTESRLKRMIKEELKKINEQQSLPPMLIKLANTPSPRLSGLTAREAALALDLIGKAYDGAKSGKASDPEIGPALGSESNKLGSIANTISDILMGVGIHGDGKGGIVRAMNTEIPLTPEGMQMVAEFLEIPLPK